jgi:DUF4097 and DUF4098 domain-containing protein YvlB
VWIIVVVVLLLACCCILAATAAVAGWFATRLPQQVSVLPGGVYRERTEQGFSVGSAPELRITSSAGNVIIEAGEAGSIQVIATKRGASQADLDQIEVSMQEQDGGLEIEVTSPRLLKNASVQLEITAPADTRLDIQLAAGNVEVCCLTSRVQAVTSAGNVEIRDAGGPVNVHATAGAITYEGTPQGDSSFSAITGAINLYLPADASVEVDLKTTVGDIDVKCDVAGRVTMRKVEGVIGSGDQGRIRADAQVGAIGLICR